MLKKIVSKITAVLIILVMLITQGADAYSVEFRKNYEGDISWLTEKPIAHRGLYNNNYPENSMTAFENAVIHGYPIELDVRFTKDKEVVVIHDDNLKRLTGDRRNVKDVTYDELKSLKLLNSTEGIPLFKDVLKVVDGRVPILVDVKSKEDGLELSSEVNKLLGMYDGKFAIQSFDSSVIQWYVENSPQVPRGMLIKDIKSKKKFEMYNSIISESVDKTNFISVSLDVVRDERVQHLGQLGCPILVWTIRNKEDQVKAKLYADNFIFDKFTPKHY